MAKLILMFNNQVLEEFPFVRESITIGRKPENDIVIDNLAVSSYHSRIDKTGTEYLLTDLQSTNGTFVNDVKVLSHRLKHGDNILIGKHALFFVGPDNGVPEEETTDGDLDKTMMLDTAKQRELLASQQKSSPSSPPRLSEKIGVLSFLEGSKLGEIELTKKLTRVGKSKNSEVKLSGLFMGATAATISRRPSGYSIAFAGGMAKLKVNGEVVKRSVPLKDFDTIDLGSFKFQFYQKEAK